MKVTNSPGIYKIIYHDHSLFLLFRERARERDRKRERGRRLSFSINLLYMSINNIYKLEFLLTFSVYNKILLIIQKN